MKEYLELKKIKLYTTENDTKASIIERYIRSLKTKMYAYFTTNNTRIYIGGPLQDIVKSLNSRYHRTIGRAPNKVTRKNEKEVFDYQYGAYLLAAKRTQRKKVTPREKRLTVGALVRISVKKDIFDKGYKPNFSEKLYQIDEIVDSFPQTYIVSEHSNKSQVKGLFYADELSFVADANL
jgi:hypothetical protein